MFPQGVVQRLTRIQALAKFAAIVLAVHDILGDKPLAQAGLGRLKLAFARFAANKQQYPLVYDCALSFPLYFLCCFALTLSSRMGRRGVFGFVCDGGLRR